MTQDQRTLPLAIAAAVIHLTGAASIHNAVQDSDYQEMGTAEKLSGREDAESIPEYSGVAVILLALGLVFYFAGCLLVICMCLIGIVSAKGMPSTGGGAAVSRVLQDADRFSRRKTEDRKREREVDALDNGRSKAGREEKRKEAMRRAATSSKMKPGEKKRQQLSGKKGHNEKRKETEPHEKKGSSNNPEEKQNKSAENNIIKKAADDQASHRHPAEKHRHRAKKRSQSRRRAS
ncbi:unnamed protein product [Cyprideis torosa]|uniref:Uncharacterized protein n=1 Tax=Cyprideis torosa TaxID=163714 RepID=A0A7R8WC52_9CRUS|nr:unnamed protein product [Cyprideis torosa]CAG0893049.1 unnamed protein product [Cyprideis torosa]